MASKPHPDAVEASRHQLRPLFAFLQAFTVPVGIYASQADFLDEERTTELVQSRIRAAARQAAEIVQRRAVLEPPLQPSFEPTHPRPALVREGAQRASAP